MNSVTIFDFDGTIFSKNAISILLRVKFYSCNIFIFLLWSLLMLAKAPMFIYLYKKDALKFNNYLYKHYKGFKQGYLSDFAKNKGFKFIRDNIYIESLETMHFAKNVVIISAGLDVFLVPFFSKLAIPPEHIFCNSLEFIDEVCTGKVKGEIIDDKVKGKYVQRVKKMFPDFKLIIYGNSKWDYHMLKMADNAFCINPSSMLTKFFKYRSLKVVSLTWNKLFFRHNIFHSVFATKFLAKIFCSQIIGDFIDQKGAIIIANHQSYIDHYLMSSLIKDLNFCFISKEEHFHSKLGRFYHSLIRIIPIDRNSAFKSMKTLLIARYAILLGINIIIYPEGTRSSGREMKQFKGGFLKLAGLFSEIKIIPVTLNNSYKILIKGKKIPNVLQKAQIVIHKPILVKSGFDEQAVLETCFNTIKSGLA